MDSDKTRLRRVWTARLVSSSAGDEALAEALGRWAEEHRFESVLATLPLNGEPDLTWFYERWLAEGRPLGLARTAPDGQMDFGLVARLEDSWKGRAFRLREPPRDAAAWTPGQKTLVLVPGLAFAAVSGGVLRLGRGGGYFDRWLAVYRGHVTSLGVGYPFQLTEALPQEPHDVLLDGYFDSQGFHGGKPGRL